MAAPTGTTWGSVVGSYGRIGLYINVTTNNNTTYAGEVQVWFWSKYTIDDTSNTLYFDNLAASGSATTSKGALHVKTTVASGEGWSTTNQVKLASYSFSYTKGTAAVTRYTYAKLANIDRVGGTMYASKSFSIPALASYTVSYNANGGSGAPSAQTKWYGKTLTLSSTKPTRTGYSFKGWATSASGAVAYASGAKYTANAAATLYAVWQANTYAVKYDANGGTGAPADQTKTHGTTLKLSSTVPTRTNYNFLGWAASASATAATYTAGGNYTNNAAVTLYAVWELAYTKPRISGLMLSRCNSEGEVTDEGTSALVSFSWASDFEISTITIEWKLASAADYAATDIKTVDNASGTSGAVNTIVGNGTIADKTYTLRITVTDSGGDSYKIATLPGSIQHIDFLAPENEGDKGGAAIGKPAELQGVFDVGYQAKFTGGILNIVAEKVSDLNELTTPNTYITVNKGASSYENIPEGLSGTFTIEVMSAGAEGQLLQRITACNKDAPKIYIRHYYQSAWGEWALIYNRDTGWLDMELQGSVAVGSDMGYLKARVKNGVLYIKGDVIGITANWTLFAKLPAELITLTKPLLASSNRFAGVYNLSNFCGFNLTSGGALYVTLNSTGAWDSTKMTSIITSICL